MSESTKLLSTEYVLVTCTTCKESVKLAKNDGSVLWKCKWESFVETFLTEHGNCPAKGITLEVV